PERFGMEHPPMPVMDVHLVQRVLARQEVHQDRRLTMQRAAVRNRGEHAAIRREPLRGARDDCRRILDMLEHVAEHDVVEALGGREGLEETVNDAHRRHAPRNRLAERETAFDDGERLPGGHEQLGHHALGGSHLEDRIAAQMSREDAERIADRVGVDARRIQRSARDVFETLDFVAHGQPEEITSTSSWLASIRNAMLRPPNATAGTGATMTFARCERNDAIASERSGATYARW